MPHQCTGCGHVFPDGSKEMLSGCPDCGGNKFQFQPSGATGGSDGAGSGQSAGGQPADGTAAPAPSEEPPEPPEPPSPGGSVAETVAGATQRVKNMVGSSDPEPAGAAAGDAAASNAESEHEWPAVGREDAGGTNSPSEDTAQASARSGTVSPEELPDRPMPEDAGLPNEPPEPPEPPSSGGSVAETEPDTEAPDADATGSAPFTGSGDRESSADQDSPDLSELRAELNDQFESIKIVERGQYELNLMELYDREEYIISLMEDGRYAIEVPETWRGES
jgi:predicted  nucleic acid-binding Zn-ribbon protein